MNKLVSSDPNTMLYTVYVVGLQDLSSQDQTVWVEVSLNVWFRDESAIGKDDEDPSLFNPAIELQGGVEVEFGEGEKGNVRSRCYFLDSIREIYRKCL
jgi:hypothetical protein